MTTFKEADALQQHRPLLLAMEAVGWLHMTGKANIGFLQEKGGLEKNYDYKKWHKRKDTPFPWDDLLNWVKKSASVKIVWPDALTSFITKHAEGKSQQNLVALLQAAHAMASGIEKNLPKNASQYLGQDVTHMWLSTAFGNPSRNLLAKPPGLMTEAGWKFLLEKIKELLTELKQLGNSDPAGSIEKWWIWREGAVGPDGWLRRAFSSTLAETRLPNNDVTLFDQSYVAAALFKSATAGAILELKKTKGKIPWNSDLKQQTHWRLLTVGIGSDHYEARAVKIGDWTGARLALNEFFSNIRKLIEVDLAVGSLLYADSAVYVFSFPGERSDGKSPTETMDIGQWKAWLGTQVNELAQEADLETPPYCNISEQPSRALVGMTAEIRKARETLAVPIFNRNWAIKSQDAPTDGHVCPVCLVRRNDVRADKQWPCKYCRKRRIYRLDSWLEGGFGLDSIWISEVADANDRVALITMNLDIEPWLDGTRLDALRNQAISEWVKFNPFPDGQKNPIDLIQGFDCLLRHIREKLKKPEFNVDDPVLRNLHDGYQHEEHKDDCTAEEILDTWKSFFSKIVEDRAEIVEDRAGAPKWDALDHDGRARWLTHQLLRKLASPGRIYRFQRQAEDFFRALLDGFRDLAAADPNRWRTRRLVIKPGEGSSVRWEDRQTYSGRLDDGPVSLLYREESKDFLTICNLARLIEPEEARDCLKCIKELKNDDSTNTESLLVKSVSDHMGSLGVYHPVIPLELSPMRFRVLLPLEAASACVDLAVAAWNEEFGRVWDRMPLRIGVVAFPRMMPFQAVIEAARAVEDDFNRVREHEIWRVAERETRKGGTALSLVPPGGGSGLRTVPVRLPDGRDDVFYPYFSVEDRQLRFPLDFLHPNGQVYRHAGDLRRGDGVHVYPPLITTLFLDSAAKRFDPVEQRGIFQWKRMRDIWKLIEGLGCSQTALQGAWSDLSQRRQAWQGPEGTWMDGGQEAWLDLARAVFHERLQARGECLETLVMAARDGLLDCSLQWHLNVLKQRIPEG